MLEPELTKIILGLFTLIGTLGGGWLTLKYTGKTSGPGQTPPRVRPEEAADRRLLEKNYGHSPVSELAPAIITILADQQRQIGAQRQKIDGQQERIRNLHEDNEVIVAENRALRTVLIDHVIPLVSWIDAGADPPPPPIADALRRLLRRAGDNDSQEPEKG